jgi:signal transduction histidine kinase
MNCPNCGKRPVGILYSYRFNGVNFKDRMNGYLRCQHCGTLLREPTGSWNSPTYEKGYWWRIIPLLVVFHGGLFYAIFLIIHGVISLFFYIGILLILLTTFFVISDEIKVRYWVIQEANREEDQENQKKSAKIGGLGWTIIIGFLAVMLGGLIAIDRFVDTSIFAVWQQIIGMVLFVGITVGGAFGIFLYFSKAEEIKKAYSELEETHKELKKTQDQLVQQEKLASLGQLTAGIAHEIKNPLNFVNNFSDLSLELVKEAREGVDDSEVLDILDNVETNLKKINEHGNRADGIVKSMLQHSRGGDGEMELTDLNGLIEEYVNLAFHGMRASEHPIDVDIKMDLDEEVGEVPLIGEDFSRVIINLCNNAFDAMREKLNSESGIQNSEEYHPKLKIKTQKENDAVTIEVKDNGPGIPEDLRDEIMQPFFTTKEGTEGTGLGLSITNDIIKAHGGSLEIKSEEGVGSKFRVLL